jgi:RNA polymerase sigma-70 factor, ECF subfamily
VTDDLEAARGGDEAAFARLVAPHRRELRAHCYRMAGSLHDADDLLQEALVRAWRGLGTFEGRASLRTWLYKVTTHACLDKLERRPARTLPTGYSLADDPSYLEPCPAELYERRETVALAFLVTLQLLTPKQRAVLILRDVVEMQATECAELLELSVAAVNSALQRAREALAERPVALPPRTSTDDALVARYVAAWERADAAALIALLRDDAILAMPPRPEVLFGARTIGAAIHDMVFAPLGPGAIRMVLTEANGLPAVAAYQRDADGVTRPLSLHVLEPRDGAIAVVTAFMDTAIFARFGLPPALPA